MSKVFYPLASSSWSKQEINSMNAVIRSRNFKMGNHVKKFENKFAKFIGSKYAVMVNSGSSANLLMFAALLLRKQRKIKRKDEIIVPAISWSTTYSPIQQLDLRLKFVDVDPKTLNFDLVDLQRKISSKTKVIVAVNLLGNSNNFHSIKKIIGKRKIILLEDNCESLGAKYRGKMSGTFGLMGTFSFFYSHHISTMEGGLISTNSKEIYQILLSIRSHGWTRDLPKKNLVSNLNKGNKFSEMFRFVLPGFNVRPLELCGAIGINQLQKLPTLLKERRKNAKIFKKEFSRLEYFSTQNEIGLSSWFGFAIILKKNSPFPRKKVLDLLEKNKIEYRPIVAGNFSRSESLKWFDHTNTKNYNNADFIDKNGFFVGNHGFDISKKIKKLALILRKLEIAYS